jgi:hypothetical protein
MNTMEKMQKILIEMNQRLPIEISPSVLFKSTVEINEKYDLKVALIISKKFSSEKFAAVNCDVLLVDKTTNVILSNSNTMFYVKHTQSKFSVRLTGYDTYDILNMSQKLIEKSALEMLLK